MRQVSFTLLMNVAAMVIELSTRGTVHSDNWYLRLPDKANAAKLPSAGLWLNASKSESMPERGDFFYPTQSRWIRIRRLFGVAGP